MKIFYSFLILVAAVTLWFLPVTEAVEDFERDLRTDVVNGSTDAGETTYEAVLSKAVSDNDTSSITILSSSSTDSPLFSSYNTTSHAVTVSGLTANTTRTLTISYDVDALSGWSAIPTLLDYVPYIWYLLILVFTPAAIWALFR